MTPLFKKLNFKDHPEVVILNPPQEFEAELTEMRPYTSVLRDVPAVASIQFAMAFVTTLDEVQEAAQKLAPLLDGDAVLWMCYPKGSSKRYTCSFNRDTGWASLGALGMEPVRQVAVNDDWSALRFRKTEFIKNLSRRNEMAISAEGRRRTSIPKQDKTGKE